ncbi:RNA-directed DNA polymerase, eukaryota [Tanacetum coccineum]
MREVVVDYGPSPFRVFHSWFTKDALKALIKAWCKDDKHCSNATRCTIQSQLSDIDKLLDKGLSNDDLVSERTSLLKDLHNLNALLSLDMAHKSKICWAIKGDENFKYFHGEWIDEPTKVKNEFLNHFSNRFALPSGPNIMLDSHMFKQINSDQIADLECDVTVEEIKRAVWDCGINKSPRPDGFTFEFIRSKSPPGSNSSFITLIPKKQDTKVDFEKVFDSVRWDYLDGILCNFGFGAKWKGWIQGCLNLAMGLILVNGSPSSEFKFHKGLKQGDPLSPFLFILVLKSLHLSFNNILNAGLFKGIKVEDSLTLSHLFYADDAVFIGKWDKANVVTIVHMLKCFFLASGLKIDMHKSKLMGIGISHDEVIAAANIIGCSTFSTLFKYLGVKVGMQTYPRMYALENVKHVSIADKLNDVSLTDSFRRSPRGGLEEEQYLSLVDIVAFVVLSNSNDIWVWSLDSTVCLDKLPTRLNLSLRGIDIPSIICPICNATGESCSHILFSCNVARILCSLVGSEYS